MAGCLVKNIISKHDSSNKRLNKLPTGPIFCRRYLLDFVPSIFLRGKCLPSILLQALKFETKKRENVRFLLLRRKAHVSKHVVQNTVLKHSILFRTIIYSGKYLWRGKIQQENMKSEISVEKRLSWKKDSFSGDGNVLLGDYQIKNTSKIKDLLRLHNMRQPKEHATIRTQPRRGWRCGTCIAGGCGLRRERASRLGVQRPQLKLKTTSCSKNSCFQNTYAKNSCFLNT